MPNAGMLENYPLYRKLRVKIPDTLDSIAKSPINMECLTCKDRRTFKMVNNYWEGYGYSNKDSRGVNCRCVYLCTACQEQTRIFMLLFSDEDLIDDNDKQQYRIALQETKNTRVTSEKIDLVQDLLPVILRPNNMNPLSLLHSVLSEGLHAGDDERCLELAVESREIIVFLVSRVMAASKEAREFTSRMQSLLEKRNRSAGA